jgi:hypothetical protein
MALAALARAEVSPQASTIVPAPEASPSPSARQPIAAGAWGGQHAQVQVTPEETRVELECIRGLISGPLEVDRKTGRVDTSGSVIRPGSDPSLETDAGLGEPARFSGKLTGKTLTLTVTLVGPAQDLGTFKLTQGRPGRLGKCPS